MSFHLKSITEVAKEQKAMDGVPKVKGREKNCGLESILLELAHFPSRSLDT